MNPGAPFTIRPATDLDDAAILHCLAAAFVEVQDQYTADAFADTVLTSQTLADRRRQMTVLAAVDPAGNLVGTIGYEVGSTLEGHIRGMAVLPAWRCQGVAQALLERAEEGIRATGARRVSLDTTAPLRRAIAFYERNGYRPTGKVTDFFGMDLFEYAKDLN
jgi:ribosomal protein S18 acetylase RimI-like enzyme